MCPFPYPGLAELRERYTWNIQPFSITLKSLKTGLSGLLASANSSGSSTEGSDDETTAMSTGRNTVTCSPKTQPGKRDSVGQLQGLELEFDLPLELGIPGFHSESTKTVDISKLRKQYRALRQRQRQAAVILQSEYQPRTPKTPILQTPIVKHKSRQQVRRRRDQHQMWAASTRHLRRLLLRRYSITYIVR